MKEALKLALDLAIMHHTDEGYADLRSKVRQLAKEALAQPEQEPVAFISPGGHIHYDPYLDSVPLYTTPPKTQWNPEPEPLTVDVVYVEGDDLFICGVHGKINIVALSEIERDIKENPDFLKGDGVYSYSVTRFDGEYGFEGRCELAPCWELCESGYVQL